MLLQQPLPRVVRLACIIRTHAACVVAARRYVAPARRRWLTRARSSFVFVVSLSVPAPPPPLLVRGETHPFLISGEVNEFTISIMDKSMSTDSTMATIKVFSIAKGVVNVSYTSTGIEDAEYNMTIASSDQPIRIRFRFRLRVPPQVELSRTVSRITRYASCRWRG